MTYTVTAAQLASITDPEIAFGTERLLPVWEVIPDDYKNCLLYTSPSPRDRQKSRMPSSA